MAFIEPKLEFILEKLGELDINTKPLWGQLDPVRMIEHLADGIRLSCGNHNYKQTIPEEHVGGAQKFLASDKKLPKNFQVEFTTTKTLARNTNLEDAIEDVKNAWAEFEFYYKTNPNAKELHPSFGLLSHEKWLELHSKHITHHLEQFGINA